MIKILPHLGYITSIMIIVFLILNNFNPMMNFTGNIFFICLEWALCVITLLMSIILIVSNSKKKIDKK